MSVDDTIRRWLADMAARHDELLQLSQDPEVTSDHVRAGKVMRELGEATKPCELFRELTQVEEDLVEARELLEMAEDEDERDLAESEIEEKAARLRAILDEAANRLVSHDKLADRNVILEVRAGTGGDEAALFAGDLFRMYSRFAERKGYKLEVLSSVGTGLGGFKEIVAAITGKGVFRNLRFESGGHRVQRVPETEAQGRIHTSLATVAVMPEAEAVDVDLKRDDLKIDFFRASGPGGQKVNKTSSAVRIVHQPTGLKVECQDEKSQHKNKARAMKILLSRLLDFVQSKAEAERSSIRRSQIGSGDRNERIRTYNFPQSRVTDHRVNLNLYNLDGVMDGDLDQLIEKLGEHDRDARLKGLAEGDD
jgi:peptide chain release factor 1